MSAERQWVQRGLRRLIDREPRWAEWPEPTLRGRLLDEVGSDHRPLVLVLLRTHDLGIPQRLPPAVIDHAHWVRARDTLAQRLVAELFLPPDVAAWSVESWAWALHVITEEFLLEPPAPPPAPRGTAAAAAGGRPMAPPRAGMAPPTRSGTPRGTGGPPAPAAPRMTAQGRAALAQGSAGAAAGGPPEKLVKLAAVSIPVMFGGWMLFIGFQMVRGGRAASEAPAATAPAPATAPAAPAPAPVVPGASLGVASARPAAAAPVVDPSRPAQAPLVLPQGNTTPTGAPTSTNQPLAADPLPGLSRSALPMTAADSAKLLMAAPPRRAAAATEVAPRNPTSAAGGLDQVTLVDGRALSGRVEVIRASTIVFRDVQTGLRYEFPKAQVVQVRTEFGTVVPFEGAEKLPRSPLVAKGVGGRYRAHFTVAEVTGTPECQTLWRRNAPPDADVEVRHKPGADTLQLAVQGGATFNAVMDREARFASTFVIVPDQALSSAAVTSRMRGAFTAKGFTGQVTLIGFRRARQDSGLGDTACQSTLDMTATKAK
jgi:hypothetical protein